MIVATVVHCAHILNRDSFAYPQSEVESTFSAEGFEVVSQAHMGLTESHLFGLVTEQQIEGMIREVAKAMPEVSMTHEMSSGYCSGFANIGNKESRRKNCVKYVMY